MLKSLQIRLMITHICTLLISFLVFFPFLIFALRGGRAIFVGLVVAGLCGLIIAVTFSIVVTRTISRPLQRFAEKADLVANGDYSQTATEEGLKEIEAVAIALNSMTQKARVNQTAMGDFIANASHELKTPLTAIQGFAQAILEDATQDTVSRQKAAKIIYEEALRMRRLIDDLLDLARIDSGQIIIGKTPIKLAMLLNVTLATLATQKKSKNLQVSTQLDDLPDVVGDSDRLAQVFMNLIDNAIKYTPAGGKVLIRGIAEVRSPFRDPLAQPDSRSGQREFAKVSIVDSGPGIDPENLARIFERLYRVDKSRKREQGMGLGLAIAYNIVKAHGGEIQVESKVGQGTRFTVWLPTKEADVSTLITKRQMRQHFHKQRSIK